MIKHLVLGAGAYNGVYILGALNYLSQIKFYDINNIESIYGGSVGGFIGAILCLKLDWKAIIKYVVDRPWDKTFKLDSKNFFSFVAQKGLFDEQLFKIFFKNLLESKELNTDITLKQLYEYSKIKLYIYTLSVDTMQIKHLSYETEPDMKLIDAVYASCCMPFVFQPKLIKDTYYIDGAIKNEYPVDLCVNSGCNKDEILGIKIHYDREKKTITENDNLLAYGWHLFNSLLTEYRTKTTINLTHEIIIPAVQSNMETALELIKRREERQAFLDLGERYAKLFLSYLKKNNFSEESNNVNMD